MPTREFEPGVSETCEAIVRDSIRITPETTDEVRQISLHIDAPAFYYPEGQHIGVLVPGPHPFGYTQHHRYYTIADARRSPGQDGVDLEILVRRCFGIDEVSGERYPGIASNYLCDAPVGAPLTLTGPYHSPFRIPADKSANLLMIGTGTGIAPFRAFLRRIYEEQGDWQGQIRLYYGARTGMDLLYMNDLNNDLASYYDRETFQAIHSLRPNLLGDESDALARGLDRNAEAILALLRAPGTHVYLSGMKRIADTFDRAIAAVAGGEPAWSALKDRLIADKRWSELTYH